MLTILLASLAALAADTISSPSDGWTVTVPAGWRYADQAGAWLLGHDTEAGMILVSYSPGGTLAEIRQQAKQGLTELGLAPKAPPVEVAVGPQTAVLVDMIGRAEDGTELHARIGAVAAPGGALVVMGLTTAEHIASLTTRVDALTRSATFRTPERGDVAALRGLLCAWSGGSVMSRTSRWSFDGAGRVAQGSETVAGGQLTDGLGNQTGAWQAGGQGGGPGGTYSVAGDRVAIRWGDGSESTCAVHLRQSDGRVTELMCGLTLYAAGLCE